MIERQGALSGRASIGKLTRDVICSGANAARVERRDHRGARTRLDQCQQAPPAPPPVSLGPARRRRAPRQPAVRLRATTRRALRAGLMAVEGRPQGAPSAGRSRPTPCSTTAANLVEERLVMRRVRLPAFRSPPTAAPCARPTAQANDRATPAAPKRERFDHPGIAAHEAKGLTGAPRPSGRCPKFGK